jgi:hypothetical protein
VAASDPCALAVIWYRGSEWMAITTAMNTARAFDLGIHLASALARWLRGRWHAHGSIPVYCYRERESKDITSPHIDSFEKVWMSAKSTR